MVEVSKILVDKAAICPYGCRDLVHPWTDNCSEAFITMLRACLRGNVMFWLPLCCLSCVSIFFPFTFTIII